MASLKVKVSTLEFRNPILSASGTFGHGLEMQHMTPPEAIGGLVSKSVSMSPRHGNPAPRICETEAGFLNSIGLENRGIESYLEHTLPQVANARTRIITNIVAEEAAEEYGELAAILDERPEVHALEVNLSCPNVGGGALPFATDPEAARRVVRSVADRVKHKPVFAKVSPNVTRVGDIARACEDGGADAITASNTLLGMRIDWRTRKPVLATIKGGYSGPGVKPVALRCAYECVQAVSVPVIGCGGISTVEDVLEFLIAGCSLVQIGTACFADPGLPARIAAELPGRLSQLGIEDVTQLIGSMG